MTPADAAAYTQTLFNRLLFVHFVSRKGWLAFSGNKDYLNTLWHDYLDNPVPAGFYAQRLDALFYDGMNTPPEQRRPGIDQIIGQAPYRNGGLFRAQRPGSAGHRHRRPHHSSPFVPRRPVQPLQLYSDGSPAPGHRSGGTTWGNEIRRSWL